MPTEDTTRAPAGANLVDPSEAVEALARDLGVWRDGCSTAEVNRLGLHIDGGCCSEHAVPGRFRVWHRHVSMSDDIHEPIGAGVSEMADIDTAEALLLLQAMAARGGGA